MAGALREVANVARLRGDEFAVVLLNVAGVDAVPGVAEKLRQVLHAPFRVEGVALDVDASIVVALPVSSDDVATLLQRANVAM